MLRNVQSRNTWLAAHGHFFDPSTERVAPGKRGYCERNVAIALDRGLPSGWRVAAGYWASGSGHTWLVDTAGRAADPTAAGMRPGGVNEQGMYGTTDPAAYPRFGVTFEPTVAERYVRQTAEGPYFDYTSALRDAATTNKYSPDQPRDERGRFTEGVAREDQLGVPRERMAVHDAAYDWSAGAYGAMRDRIAANETGQDRVGRAAAVLLRAANAAAPTARPLYRGLGFAVGKDFAEAQRALSPGRTVRLNLSSWTADRATADEFGSGHWSTLPGQEGLRRDPGPVPFQIALTLDPGARALDVSRDILQQGYSEWLTAGRFEVESASPRAGGLDVRLRQVGTLDEPQLLGAKAAGREGFVPALEQHHRMVPPLSAASDASLRAMRASAAHRKRVVVAGGRRRDAALAPIIARLHERLVAALEDAGNIVLTKYSEAEPRDEAGRWTDAYLDEAGQSRVAVNTFLGRTLIGATVDQHNAARVAIHRELQRRTKTGEVFAVRSVGGRLAFVRREALTAADQVIHGHALKFDESEPRDERGRWTADGSWTPGDVHAAQIDGITSTGWPGKVFPPGYYYHGTSSRKLDEIRREGLKAQPYGWDQGPKRPVVFFGEANKPLGPLGHAYDPEQGYAGGALLRIPVDTPGVRFSQDFMDVVAEGDVPPHLLEVWGSDGAWHPLVPGTAQKFDPGEARDEAGRWTAGGAAVTEQLPRGWMRHNGTIYDTYGGIHSEADLARVRGEEALSAQVAALNAAHPGTLYYNPMLSGMDPAKIGPALTQMGHLQDQFPMVTLKEVTAGQTGMGRSGAAVLAETEGIDPYDPERRIIIFNDDRFSTFSYALDANMKPGWLVDTSPAGIATHEFGHAVEGYLRDTGHADVVNAWNQAAVSGYADAGSSHEKFAEMFSQAYSPGSAKAGDVPSQQFRSAVESALGSRKVFRPD